MTGDNPINYIIHGMVVFALIIGFLFLSFCAHAYISVPFIKNESQVSGKVLYYAPLKAGYVFVRKDGGIGYVFSAGDKAIVFIEKIGRAKRIYGDEAVSSVNYPAKGVHTKSYRFVKFEDVFKGIDLILRVSLENVEKLFYIKPGSSPESISVKLEGVKNLSVDGAGLLVVNTEVGAVKFTKPVAYQYMGGERRYIDVSYHLKGKNTYGFKVEGKYDPSKPLIIDPLIASTFLGGADRDEIISLKMDQNGNIYVLGTTVSSNFPVTPGVYKDLPDDIFISKLSPDLSTLEVSTFFGGSGVDYPVAMEIDSIGNIYILGRTRSSDFPVTTSATYRGFDDVFIVKLTPDLQTLVASTLFGGSDDDMAFGFTFDSAGNIYITGATRSGDFSGFPPGYSIKGDYDIFILKIDSNFSLLSSIPFGADGRDVATHVVVDGGNNVYITGFTTSQFFPTTASAYDPAYNSGSEAFISKFDQNLNLLSSTYLGGLMDDLAFMMLLDQNGNVYVAGVTFSANFPITQGVVQNTNKGGGDIFVAKLPADLSDLLISTFVGGSGFDIARDMKMDQNGYIYIGCNTSSPDFPVSSGAFMSRAGGNFDGCIVKLTADLQSVVASTYLGGEYNDGINSILIDPNRGVYVAGFTWSSDFPVTVGSFMDDHPVSKDGFISLLDTSLSANSDPQIISFSADRQKGRAPLKVNFTCEASDRDGSIVGYKFDLDGDGKFDYEGSSKNVFFIYWEEGKYKAVCVAINSLKKEVAKEIYITVEPSNYPPSIDSFSADPLKGTLPLEVTFNWKVSDKDGDKLNCVLDPGDGKKIYTVDNCDKNTVIRHTYKSEGGFTVKFTVTDPKGSSVSKEIKIGVSKAKKTASKSGCFHTNVPIFILCILILVPFIRRIL